MRLSHLIFPFTFILSCIAQNWDENLEYLPEEESLIEEEYINEEGLLILEDAEASFSWLNDIGNWVADTAASAGDAIADTAEAIGDGISDIFDNDDKDNSQSENNSTSEAPETPVIIDIVSPITWNTTLEGYIITAYREESVVPDEPGSRMSTNATFVISGYYAGRITAETKIWTEKANWGFMGEVYVELLGENNITIGTTGNHTVGVNGEILDPRDWNKLWEEWLQVSWAQLTLSLKIVQTYNNKNLPVVEEETNISWPEVGGAQDENSQAVEGIETGASIATDAVVDAVVDATLGSIV